MSCKEGEMEKMLDYFFNRLFLDSGAMLRQITEINRGM